MPDDEVPKFIHDTKRIVSANLAACKLFRCDLDELVDLDMIDLLVTDDYKGLARARMRQMRESGDNEISPFTYIMRRHDNSKVWVTVTSKDLLNGTFETTVIYIREKPDKA